MTETFTWQATSESSGQTRFRVRRSQFGDGYSQAVADGINNKVQDWPLHFAGTWAELSPITAFLDARAGWESFYWTPPHGTQALYRASEYSLTPQGGDVFTLNVTFQQVFSP